MFKLIARNCEDVFRVITDYMNGQYRSYMDIGNPLYLNKTPKQILSSLGIRIKEHRQISEIYDELYTKYYPLHETSLKNGVEKLYQTSFE